MERKLAIVCSHPIQYYAPMFRYFAKSMDVEVIYCHQPSAAEIGKQGFGLAFEWDTDLLSGYRYSFQNNVSKKPAMDSFFGCDTPGIGKKIKEIGATHVLILGWYLKSYIQAYWYCLRNNLKVAVRGDSQLNPSDSFWKDQFKRFLYPLFLKNFTKILFVGKRNKDYLIHYGARESQLIYAPHAVDQEFWSNESIIDFEKDKNITTFIWVGKFTEKKRPLDAVLSFKQLHNQNLRLWMIGTGELLQSTKFAAKNDSRIQFLGFKNQTELRKIYKESDCILLTSNFLETWGLVINEAFASSIPAIVSNSCGCSADFVIHDENGYIYPEGDISTLSGYMESFHSNKDIQLKKFQENIIKINHEFSYERNLKAVLMFLNS